MKVHTIVLGGDRHDVPVLDQEIQSHTSIASEKAQKIFDAYIRIHPYQSPDEKVIADYHDVFKGLPLGVIDFQTKSKFLESLSQGNLIFHKDHVLPEPSRYRYLAIMNGVMPIMIAQRVIDIENKSSYRDPEFFRTLLIEFGALFEKYCIEHDGTFPIKITPHPEGEGVRRVQEDYFLDAYLILKHFITQHLEGKSPLELSNSVSSLMQILEGYIADPKFGERKIEYKRFSLTFLKVLRLLSLKI